MMAPEPPGYLQQYAHNPGGGISHQHHPAAGRTYEIIVRQEPKQARMCGVGGKADRRPIDPPPIVQLRVLEPNQSGTGPPMQPLNFLQNPYYFMFASLASADTDEELHLLKDGKTRCTTGSVVSSLYHLKDTERGGEDAGFFVFPDLSVRTEGSYRLKLTLFEVVGSYVQFCKSVYSRAFYVYTAKKFPGMEESTPLSIALSDQGIKIRIRKDVRSRKRPPNQAENADPNESEDEPEQSGKRKSKKQTGRPVAKRQKTADGDEQQEKQTSTGRPQRTKRRPDSSLGGKDVAAPDGQSESTFRVVPEGEATQWDDLPAPTIPGGEPIDPPYHPLLKRHEPPQRLVHQIDEVERSPSRASAASGDDDEGQDARDHDRERQESYPTSAGPSATSPWTSVAPSEDHGSQHEPTPQPQSHRTPYQEAVERPRSVGSHPASIGHPSQHAVHHESQSRQQAQPAYQRAPPLTQQQHLPGLAQTIPMGPPPSHLPPYGHAPQQPTRQEIPQHGYQGQRGYEQPSMTHGHPVHNFPTTLPAHSQQQHYGYVHDYTHAPPPPPANVYSHHGGPSPTLAPMVQSPYEQQVPVSPARTGPSPHMSAQNISPTLPPSYPPAHQQQPMHHHDMYGRTPTSSSSLHQYHYVNSQQQQPHHGAPPLPPHHLHHQPPQQAMVYNYPPQQQTYHNWTPVAGASSHQQALPTDPSAYYPPLPAPEHEDPNMTGGDMGVGVNMNTGMRRNRAGTEHPDNDGGASRASRDRR